MSHSFDAAMDSERTTTSRPSADAPRRRPHAAIGNQAVQRLRNESGGVSLPAPLREHAERFFGTSFSDVRLHHGAAAATAARQLGARGFTVGRNIYFGEDWYQPRTRQGAELLGHELAHVVQQRRAAATLQMQPLATPQEKPKKEPLDLTPHIDEKKWAEWSAMADVKKAIADKIAHEYVKSRMPAVQPPRTTTSLPTVTTYLEANVAPPPTEERISLALQSSLDKIKSGKGDKLSDWTWKPAAEGPAKTGEEKLVDIGEWGAEEAGKRFAERWVEKRWAASPLVETYGLGATRGMAPYLARQEIFKAAERKIAKITIELAARDILGVIAVASGAGAVIGFLLNVWSVIDLFRELGEHKAPSAWQVEDERIVTDVLLWLQAKEEAEALKQPVQSLYAPIRNPMDKSAVSPFTFPH